MVSIGTAEAMGRPVHTRAEWKARGPRRPVRVLAKPPDHIVVHHTASANTDDRSPAHAFALSRTIQNLHMDDRGWDDIGEHLTLSRGGHVMEGRAHSLHSITRGRLVVGAQARGENTRTIGIENEGTYTSAEVPHRLWEALIDTCVWLCSGYGLDPMGAITGHRDHNDTECPGGVLYARLPELRDAVAKRLGVVRVASSSPAADLSLRTAPGRPGPMRWPYRQDSGLE